MRRHIPARMSPGQHLCCGSLSPGFSCKQFGRHWEPPSCLRGCCAADGAVEHGLTCPSAHASRLLWRAPGCHNATQWDQKISPLVKVCSLQSALHDRSTFAPLPLSRELGPHQARSFCCWSALQNVLYSCTPCWMRASYTDVSPCPLLLRQQGEGNKSCLSTFAKRETLQKLASVCWGSGASREWLHVGFFRIRVCSCFIQFIIMHVCMHNNVFNITLQSWSFPEILLANLVTPKWETLSAYTLCRNVGMKKRKQAFLQHHQ